jgi:tetratricopeptide (TPR) repeat protein
VALANTLLNTATLFSRPDQPDELEPLYRRVLELDRAAVRAAPDDPVCNAEMALGLEDQGLFFLETGRGPQAEAAIREALAIRRKVLAGGQLKGSIERYVARGCANLGRVLIATGQAPEAEPYYREAVTLLDRLLKELPESALRRAELARALAGQADLFKALGRRPEAEAIWRRVIRHYEALKADFPEDPQHRRELVASYLELVSLLWDLGRQAEAAEPYRKALKVDPEDHGVNNELAWFLATSPEPRLWDPALAVRLAQKAVAALPKSPDYRNTLGVAHYRNGDDRAAVAGLEAAMSLRAGGNSFDWFFLATAHWRLGDRDQARPWFNRAVQWMDRHQPYDGELRRFRAEAEALLAEAGER